MRENSFFELHFEVNKLMILSEILADCGGGGSELTAHRRPEAHRDKLTS